ncbi:MAG: amino acid ABC transporter substrate-binding protein [Alphaproteobacteria bacterium]|nr:amino acid ABC transporter substrate-binding protein [Alphaproteobacteria bacterium]
MKHLSCVLITLSALALFAAMPTARAEDKPPITIGFSIELTGGLANVGKSGLLAFQIWAEDINKKGGLLGRPVKLVYYDDQSNPATVPGIYTKLIDIDKVDLLISSYATNMVVPALPIVIQHNRTFFGLFALAANSQFHYQRYFSMLVFGPDPKHAFSKGWFDIAMAQNPKPQTIGIISADAEFGKNAAEGARDNAKAAGLQIVYDRAYPPSTVDYTPIIRSAQAANPDITYVASYPPDTVGILHAVSELGYKTQMFGGALVGVATAALRTQLGPLMNGVVVGELWEPAPTMQFPGILDFLKEYQAKAPGEGVDPLGYFLPPFAYSELQILGDAVEATKALDDDKLGQYLHAHSFNTIIGDIAFGPDGEWTQPRPIFVQYHGIAGNGLDQFRDTSRITVLDPPQYKTGELIYPYAKARE